MFAGRLAKTDENTEVIIQEVLIWYDVPQGREKKRWADPKHSIWSITATDNGAVALSADGILLALGPNGFEALAEYPRTSYYLPIAGAEPIICVGPDLTKLNWRLGVCYREGEFDWKKEGVGWVSLRRLFVVTT